MGTCTSSPQQASPWKQMVEFDKVKSKYMADKSVPEDCTDDHIQLKALLDDQIGFRYIEQHAQSGAFMLSIFNFYNTVNDYKAVGEKKYQKLCKLTEKLMAIMVNQICPPSLKAVDAIVIKLGHLKAAPETSLPFNLLGGGGSSRRVAPGSGKLEIETDTGGVCVSAASESLCSPTEEVAADFRTPEEELEEFYHALMLAIFDCLYEHVYIPFKNDYEFERMCDAIRQSYNNVSVDDFQYLTKIGEGGFGLIVHCRKLSTGRNFAMKIQPKAALLKHFRRTPFSVMLEMKAYCCCNHPYLASLAYAIQTPTVAVMVMPLSACGDLGRALRMSETGRLDLLRVQFYTAEITSALLFLHDNKLIYRDLKPGNILLNADGHVMLADFGSLADMEGRLGGTRSQEAPPTNNSSNNKSLASGAGSSRDSKGSDRKDVSLVSGPNSINQSFSKAPVFAVQHNIKPAHSINSVHSTHSDVPVGESIRGSENDTNMGDQPSEFDAGFHVKKRAGSLVGTIAYMAPEILRQFGKGEVTTDGYTEAVDWWSLGITVFKLLEGEQPFTRMSYEELQFLFPIVVKRHDMYVDAFTEVFGKLSFTDLPVKLPPATCDFIAKLLDFVPHNRLGMDHNEIQAHPFFEPYPDFEELQGRQYDPPYIPHAEIMESMMPVSSPVEELEKGKSFSFRDRVSEKLVGVITGRPSPVSPAVSPSVVVRKYDHMLGKDYTFRDMMRYYNKGSWVPEDLPTSTSPTGSNGKYRITDEQQFYFKEWNYCSPAVIDEEYKQAQQDEQAGKRKVNPLLSLTLFKSKKNGKSSTNKR